MKPPMPYYGGKSRLAETIAALLPDHVRYVEPFAGSLAVLLTKPPSKHEIVNDLDQNLMVFWRVLRDQPEELARRCLMTPHSRQERRDAIHIPSDATDLERARLVWSALVQGRSGTLVNTGWRHSRDARGGHHSKAMRMYAERIERVAERIRDVSLECRPALEVIERYGGDTDTLIYADPPYLGSTRRHNYKHEMGGERRHRELAEVLHSCRATVILSGYHSALYDEMFSDWFRVELAARTDQGAVKGTERTEVIWSNRALKTRHTAGVTETACDGFSPLCARCGRVVPKPKRGPMGVYCGGACRTAAWRDRRDIAAVEEEAAG